MLCIYQLLEGIKISGNVVGLKINSDGGEVQIVPTTDNVLIQKDDPLFEKCLQIYREIETIFDARRKHTNSFKTII